MREIIKLPNKTSPDAPIGKENKLMGLYGKKNEFTFEPLDHLEIGTQFDLFDFENATKLTSSKFCMFKNEAALLELALSNWAFQKMYQKGYTPITTPDLINQTALDCCGFQP